MQILSIDPVIYPKQILLICSEKYKQQILLICSATKKTSEVSPGGRDNQSLKPDVRSGKGPKALTFRFMCLS